MATIHIQNTAPGPPVVIATATPATFPVPTREAAEIVNALKEDIPSASFSSCVAGRSITARNISGSMRTCTTMVLTAK